MNCDVCITADFDGQVECAATSTPKARKQARCCECGLLIAPGNAYHRYSGRWEGKWFVTKTCLICAEIRTAFYCNGWLSGVLWEDMREAVFDNPNFSTASECFTKLSAAAKQRVLDEWRRWKGLAA